MQYHQTPHARLNVLKLATQVTDWLPADSYIWININLSSTKLDLNSYLWTQTSQNVFISQ